MTHDFADPENHIIGTSLLPLLAIHLGPVPQLLRIANDLGGYNAGPHGREVVEGLGVAELAAGDGGRELVVARGDVVGDGVAEDVRGVVFRGRVLAVPRDDEGEFAFVVEHALAGRVDGDRVEGAGERVARLGEDGGVGGDGELGVLLVSGHGRWKGKGGMGV